MEEALRAGEAALQRDPREACFGLLASGEFLHEGAEVFMWFDSVEDLVTHLLDVEPMLLAGLADGPDIESYRERIRPPLDQVLLHGCQESARIAFNDAAEGYMLIDWWGQFSELAAAQSPTSRDLLTWFREPDDSDGQEVAPLADHELEAFVAFLRSW